MKPLTPEQLKALEKLKTEIEKDIGVAVETAKYAKLFELLYFIYELKRHRLQKVYATDHGEQAVFIQFATNIVEESVKYSIQLIAKYYTPDLTFDKESKKPVINFKVTQLLDKQTTYINSKYESLSMVQLFIVTLMDPGAKKLKIDMSNVNSDIDAKKFFDYFLRIDRDNDIKKSSTKMKYELLKNFKEEYDPVGDLFQKAYSISVDEFCEFINKILERAKLIIEKTKHNFEFLPNGNVNDQSFKTFLVFVPSFLINERELASFGKKYDNLVDLLTFKPDKYDEKQLRFHLITRTPFIKVKKFFVISPELLLDSLFTNTHYSLLESTLVKEEYKARQANLYLDKLVSIASKYGYTEVEREKDLFEKGDQIGDIDLILKDKDGNFLLIEAKNHMLPMDIYFKDILKTREHLSYLQTKWEEKVLKRVAHLQSNHSQYGIPASYKYIVVSRFPEIISHYSNLLILSTAEFEFWLSRSEWSDSFDVITTEFYKTHEDRFTKEDLERLSESQIFFGNFGEKKADK
ncbi:MAG: hypothetical protein V4635_01535 [Bacteroidota bacterium]